MIEFCPGQKQSRRRLRKIRLASFRRRDWRIFAPAIIPGYEKTFFAPHPFRNLSFRMLCTQASRRTSKSASRRKASPAPPLTLFGEEAHPPLLPRTEENGQTGCPRLPVRLRYVSRKPAVPFNNRARYIAGYPAANAACLCACAPAQGFPFFRDRCLRDSPSGCSGSRKRYCCWREHRGCFPGTSDTFRRVAFADNYYDRCSAGNCGRTPAPKQQRRCRRSATPEIVFS